MKKKLLVIGAIVCLVAILAAGTLAYFTSSVVTHNVITTSGIDISVVEEGPDGSTPLPDGGFSVTGVMPDSTIKKEVAVKNEVQEPAWIRVELVCSIVGKDGNKLETEIDGTQLITYTYPDDFAENWVEKDGFYYYKKPLAKNEATSLLIKEVSVAPEMNNPYQECTVTVAVKAYAVQVKNNNPEGGVLAVEGWPATT